MLLQILAFQSLEDMLNALQEDYVTDCGILNSIWLVNKIDILSSTWQTFAHIVNLTNPSIETKVWGPMYSMSIIWVYS